jgi:hypothetical protein
MSPDWAVVDTRISRMDGAAGTLHGGFSAGSLVLEIEGVSMGGKLSLPEQPDQEQNLDDLLGQFDKNMDTMQRVMAGFEKRRLALQGADEDAGPATEEETDTPEEETQRPEDRLEEEHYGTTKEKGKTVDEAVGIKADSAPQTTSTVTA